MINITIDRAQIESVHNLLASIGKESAPLLARVLNKTAAKAKTVASAEIRKQIILTATYVREKLQGPDDSTANRAFPDRLSARISAPSRGLLLSHFATTKPANEGAIKVKVKPNSAAKIVEGKPGGGQPFWIVLKNSHTWGIAQHLASPGPRGGKLDVLHGPSLSQVLTTVKDDISPAMSTFLADKIDAEVSYILNKFRGT